jgi:hypothetical protein
MKTLADYADAIAARIEVTDTCWLWTGHRDQVSGYGTYSTPRHDGAATTRLAHRLVYLLNEGEIPKGLVLDHLCRVRHCVNPAHLEPVTNRENSRRSPLVFKEACAAGHRYTEGSYYLTANGARLCKECRRAEVRESAARRARSSTRRECEHCGEAVVVKHRSRHMQRHHLEHYQPRSATKPPLRELIQEDR